MDSKLPFSLHLDTVLEAMPDALVIIDRGGRIVLINQQTENLFGYKRTELLGQLVEQLMPARFRGHHTQHRDGYFKSPKVRSMGVGLELFGVQKDGTEFPVEISLSPLDTEDGLLTLAAIRDISKRIYLEKKLEHQATHDSLTDLPNRELLIDRIQKEITIAARSHSKFAVIFFDLDQFKQVNDSFGHTVGDEVLLTVTKRVSVTIRGEDTLARLGGDEFVIILRNLQKRYHAIRVTNKVLETIKTPIQIADREFMMTASIGVSIYPDDGTTVDELLRNADLAMYRAKEMGRDCTQFFYSKHRF